MQLARFPRRRYTAGPTPLERLDRLGNFLGGPTLYIKRDDLLGLAAGGNKTRKLEFLVAEALSQGADTLITTGAVQSNHCRLTLAAANREGLRCRLILEERVQGSYSEDASGNNFLFRLMGAEKLRVVPGGSDLAAAMQAEADELAAAGRKGFVIPGGGSTARGALGYAACAQEILNQAFEQGLTFDHLVCASGSAGTHAGLLAGLTASSAHLPITGICVNRPRQPQEARVRALAQETAELIGIAGGALNDAVTALDEYVGPGYSHPTREMREAVQLLATLEGILLDPVYTGKAMAGMIDLVRKGMFRRNQNVLFLHTGGSPALFAYPAQVL